MNDQDREPEKLSGLREISVRPADANDSSQENLIEKGAQGVVNGQLDRAKPPVKMKSPAPAAQGEPNSETSSEASEHG